ncbi:2-dehydro-3-deoxygalactonokinase [Pseudocolwellia sp. AS88]|uniref:2-dehydro-3-deoxygalactonokinase n=1 Tax=Pseudocolwellia sp. AS88 TaxID=3063958 RepID=UPI0026EFB672|nr:2-dehydro-3-deoxygalactonokinase [Pseudocolwellia sp. AS88]MDO7084799.1 2-dehydro-3-deoxygalactonokinase [Pseudocolwellia sp. AS88]
MLIHKYVVAVDWGTSHLRAFLCKVNDDKTLTLTDNAKSLGVNKVVNSFEKTLFDCIAPWVNKYGKIPVFMMGQIGSSIGWKETSYLPCPTSLEDIASKCINFSCNDHDIVIVPGVSCRLSNDNYDVMRGEELQVLGWLQQSSQHSIGTHLICLPGTHTKWVLVKDGKIELFKTAMTGELFDLLINHSILIKKNNNATFDLCSFQKGADFTLKSELGSFTHGLFSVRSKQLFGELTNSQAYSYLSGLLIGSDVRAAMNAEEWQLSQIGDVSVIGENKLSQQFSQVLKAHDIKMKIYEVSEITLLGFNAVYQQFIALPSSK